MKKLIPLLLVSIVVLSGLGAAALSESDQTFVCEKTITLSPPQITTSTSHSYLNFLEATSIVMDTGAPMLPVVTQVFTVPLNSHIGSVDVTFSDWNSIQLEKPLACAPAPQPLVAPVADDSTVHTTPSVVGADDATLYPYTVTTGVGLKGDTTVRYISVRCVPVRYQTQSKLLSYAEHINIALAYTPPNQPVVFGDTYDLFIITPAAFQDALTPLIEHKETMGVRTAVETVEDIYAAYDGQDDPEDIKLRICDARIEWGIDFVLLFGGRDGQTYGWHIPERVTNNDDGWERGYSSDLYYADLFKLNEENETVFEDWDSNENGIFAEWGANIQNRDYMDYYPDVQVGRLPIRYASEIEGVITKIIEYEQPRPASEKEWFRSAVAISGDTFPPSRGGNPGFYEGEDETGLTADLFESLGYDVKRLFTSTGTFTGPSDVIDAINEGPGFVHFAGHGNPAYWGNFLPDAESEEGMLDGLQLRHMPRLRNGYHLPIVVVGGCHNGQFNVTMRNLLHDIRTYGIRGTFFEQPFRFFYMEWVPWDWASLSILTKNGGAIATMGNSGLGYGYVNENWNAGLGGWIEPHFFDVFVNQNKTKIAEAHSQAITDYINIIGNVNSDQIDRKTIEEWILFADPSLQIGGYTV